MAEGNLVVFPDLSLFPLLLICIFLDCFMESSGFCLIGSGFWGDKFLACL